METFQHLRQRSPCTACLQSSRTKERRPLCLTRDWGNEFCQDKETSDRGHVCMSLPSCDIHGPLQKYNTIWHQKAIPKRNTKAIYFYHLLLLSLKRKQQTHTQSVLGQGTLYLAKMRATWIYIYTFLPESSDSRLHCLLPPSLDYLKYIYSQI